MVNKAVTNSGEFQTLYTVDESKTRFDSKISSLDRAHVEKFAEYDSNVCDAILEVKVSCVRLDKLISDYNLAELDLLYIDAEGYDLEIIKMIPWESCSVSNVLYEHCHLGTESRAESYRLLRSRGFELYQHGRDVLAIKT